MVHLLLIAAAHGQVVGPPTTRTVVPSDADVQVITTYGEIEALTPQSSALRFRSKSGQFRMIGSTTHLEALRGKSVVLLHKSKSANPGDKTCDFALRLPAGSSFEPVPGDSPTLTFYRALTTYWSALDVPTLTAELSRMPALDRGPNGPTYFDQSTPEVMFIAEAARGLSRVKRILVLRHLHRDRFRSVEAELEDAIWDAKDDAAIKSIDLSFRLTDDGARGPKNYFVKGDMFLEKALASSQDAVRAFYIRSIESGAGVDRVKMAKLLNGAGPHSKLAIVAKLGHFSMDENFYVERIPNDRLNAEIERLVKHWKRVYGV